MSVQVRARREAAGFLSSFVGAQGELLVDTTNNRIQVHDGATPGGWPAAKLSEVLTSSRTPVADANYTALAADRMIGFTALTAARTVTLPASSAYPVGALLLVLDESGACSSSSTITVARAGADTINGATSALVNSPYGFLALTSNGAGKWTVVDFTGATTAQLTNRNAVVNGNFAINQRAYASAASLAAGAYAHDRWKAGAGGAAYSFSQSVPDTTITITSGTLVQAIDAPNVYTSAWWLTWIGTAQARVWQGSPTGAFANGLSMSIGGVTVNAMLVTGLAVGTIAGIEFGTGTLGLVQVEAALPNAGPTRFERRQIAQEMVLCQRYYTFLPLSVGFWDAASSTRFWQVSAVGVTMRATPTVTLVSAGGGVTDPYTASYTISSIFYVEASATSIAIGFTTSSGTAGRCGYPHVDVKVGLNAEI